MRPPTMAITPEMMEFLNTNSRIPIPATLNIPREMRSCITSIPTPKMKDTHTAAFVTFLLYREYRNGARNAPASAPQETPII